MSMTLFITNIVNLDDHRLTDELDNYIITTLTNVILESDSYI